MFTTVSSSLQVQCTAPCEVYNYFGGKREEARRKVASFLGADADEIVLTRNTTEGMNFVANGLDLERADEVLMSDMEHPTGIHPWRLKAAREGIVTKEVPLGLPPGSVDEIVDTFEKALTPRLKGELAEIPGVRLHTSTDPYLSAGLTAFSIEGVSPDELVNYLRERYNLVIRTIGSEEEGTRGVRVSTHVFVFHEHVDMLLEGVRALVGRPA